MSDEVRVWTTVGSAGTLNQADLAKVSLHQSIVQLGAEVITTQGVATTAAVQVPGPVLTNVHATVRYNVTPVDGLFPPLLPNGQVPPFHYVFEILFRNHVTAKLMEVDLSTGAEIRLILFDSTNPNLLANSNLQLGHASADKPSTVMDFVSKAYYVEATLIAPQAPVGRPAEVSIIKVLASRDFSG